MINIFGSKGNGNGQFNQPYGIINDAKNQRIIVSDSNNHRIQFFKNNEQCDYLSQFGSLGNNNGQFNNPSQLCVDPINNHIIIADSFNNRIQILNEQFEFVTVIGQGQLQYPCAVDCSLSHPHHIVIADYQHEIHLYSNSHNNNNNNNSEYQLLRSFSSHGSNKDQTNRVNGICFDDEHKRILICDCNNNRLSVWSSDGSQFIKIINMPTKDYYPLSV